MLKENGPSVKRGVPSENQNIRAKRMKSPETEHF
jgi:hypothetical protein